MSQDKDHEQAPSGFKVDDRRMFNAEGEPVERESRPSPEKSVATPSSSVQEGGANRRAPSERAAQEATEGVDFSSFVLSLATSAMAYLGEVPDPSTGKKVENLEGAKQMIDILSILKEKTQGNLESDEDRLLGSLLYELRMKYLSKARVIKL